MTVLRTVIDHHAHTAFCGHAEGSPLEMAQSALKKGLAAIGFAGHCPYPPGYMPDLPRCVIPQADFQPYWDAVGQTQKAMAGRIRVLRGLEVDDMPGHVDWTRGFLHDLDLDFVLGSVHILRDVTIDYRDAHVIPLVEALGGVEGLWSLYWDRVEALVRSGLVDMLAHPDLPRKLAILRPASDDRERVDAVLDAMRSHDVVLEVNTGGIDRAADRAAYPAEWILKRALQRGIPISLGSDAHCPREVGRYFPETISRLKAMGFGELTVVEGRRQRRVPLP